MHNYIVGIPVASLWNPVRLLQLTSQEVVEKIILPDKLVLHYTM